MSLEPRFSRIESCVYEVGRTGYRVERMEDASWHAYLPSECGYRLWQSTHHSTRASAAMAVSAERKRIAKIVRTVLGNEDSV